MIGQRQQLFQGNLPVDNGIEDRASIVRQDRAAKCFTQGRYLPSDQAGSYNAHAFPVQEMAHEPIFMTIPFRCAPRHQRE